MLCERPIDPDTLQKIVNLPTDPILFMDDNYLPSRGIEKDFKLAAVYLVLAESTIALWKICKRRGVAAAAGMGFDVRKIYDENFRYVTNEKYTGILNLHKLLQDSDIEHTISKFCDGWQIVVPADDERRMCDVIQDFYSYGVQNNHLEMMIEEGRCSDDSQIYGDKTAEEMLEIIKGLVGASADA